MPSLLTPLIGRQQGRLQGQEMVRQREAQDLASQQEAEDRQNRMKTQALEQMLLERSVNAPAPPSPLEMERVRHENAMALEKLRQQGAVQTAQVRQQGGAGGVADRPTDFSRKAAFLEPRAAEAAETLRRYYDQGVPARQGAQKIPIVGNYLLSDEQRQMRQAAEVVAGAILRLESGATITREEVENLANQMIPAPGDDKNTLAQKRRTLELTLTQLQRAAGPSAGSGSTGNIELGNDPATEQRADYDRAAQALKAQGANPAQIIQTLGPRP